MDGKTLEALFDAMKQDDIASFQHIIDYYVNPHEPIYQIPPNNILFGISPFPIVNIAASFGAFLCVSYLMEHNIIENSVDGFNNTALHCAAFSGKVEILKILLEHNYESNLLNKNGELPIHIASIYSNNHIVSFLTEGRLNKCDIKNYMGKTPLSLAVEKNNIDLAEYLIQNCGCDVTVVDNYKNTLLHLAVQNLSGNTAPFLISINLININNINYSGETALLLAAKKGSFDFFVNLLSFGSNPLILDKKGRSVLHYAIISKNFDLVKFILENKLVYPAQEDANGMTPFHFAVKYGDLTMVQFISQYDISNINNSKNGMAPLHIACKHNKLEIVKFLLSFKNIDHNIENLYGQSILHIASRLNSIDILLFLLGEFDQNNNKFDISLPDVHGVF
ncbi:hypothetical protein TRFO_15464 [Tritrichomonas foetus]|uniref:Uncharacterized protein n=1 Tax=Tritrichomonas foetus TaxID=1144522 RepID=A0A1J4KSP3_9EUKA|nr:hypothetical protein TRFO_15464 [Tritrichomonas foetus]|eukprot:OHT14283.1 hypothetical protein TRFO_15464 [Tritrichomonas foetus]